MNTVELTHHGKKRIKERCGIKKSSAKRFASLAMERGVERESTKGSLRKLLDRMHDRCRDRNGSVWVYGDKAFVFTNDDVLITVLPIPVSYRRMVLAAVRH